MKKTILIIGSIFALLVINTFMGSCKKKSDPSPSTSVNGTLSAIINGVAYSAQTQMLVKNDSTDQFNSIAANGTYAALSYTATGSNIPFPGFVHCFELYQFNRTNTDTLDYGILIASKNPIAVGSTYTIYSDNIQSAPSGTAFSEGFAENSSMKNFNDSTSIGTITITELDLTNGLASGTFNFTNYGNRTGGSIPAITVSNGIFNNLKIQTFN
jgi:hypothetical protein